MVHNGSLLYVIDTNDEDEGEIPQYEWNAKAQQEVIALKKNHNKCRNLTPKELEALDALINSKLLALNLLHDAANGEANQRIGGGIVHTEAELMDMYL